MKVLYLTKYARNGASSRMRSFQYFPFLKSKGMHIKHSTLFNEQYLEELYNGNGISKLNVIKCYLKRVLVLFTVFKYDKIVIEKELFPYFPASFEKLLALLQVKYIVDYDDAIFHNYDLSSNKFIKYFLSDKIDKVMRNAYLVVAGNIYLQTRAISAGARKTIVIPTVIDSTRYDQKIYSGDKSLVVGWIGTKSTFEKHLMLLEKMINEITHKYSNVYFHIIGASDNKVFNEQVRFIPWSEVTEIEEILKFDVGIMPLEDSPWEKGKCAYKLIQYMACGIPGIASNIGANKELISTDNGFLIDTPAGFESVIHSIMADRELLVSKSINAIKTVKKYYTLQIQQEVWYNVLKNDK